MKKLILMLLMFLPFMTGCSKIDANIDFIDTKNVFFSANLNTDETVSPKEIKIIKQNFKNYIDDDYVTDVFFSRYAAKIEAVKLSKNIKRNDINLSSLGFKTKNKSGRFIDVKQNIFVTLYNVDLVYDLDRQADKINKKIIEKKKEFQPLKPEYLQKYGDEEISLEDPQKTIDADFKANFDDDMISRILPSKVDSEDDSQNEKLDIADLDLQFSVTLPSRASYNNADRVDENTYYWFIKTGKPIKIKLQYIVYNSFGITVFLLIVFGLLYFIARKILKHDAQKRIGTNN